MGPCTAATKAARARPRSAVGSAAYWRVAVLVAFPLAVASTAAGNGALTSPPSGPPLHQQSATPHDAALIAVDVVLAEDQAPKGDLARRAWIRGRQDDVLSDLPVGEFVITRRYVNLSGFAGTASPSAIAALMVDPRVSHIAEDAKGRFDLVEGVPLVGGGQAAAMGYQGLGMTVAVLDSGVDASDPDLADSIAAEECFCNGGCCPNGQNRQSGGGSAQDTDGHGTAVAGVITANGVSVGPGVAPDADIVAIKVGQTSGTIALSDLGAALDWLVSNHQALGVRVVNLSISFGVLPANDPLVCVGLNNTATAIAALSAAGVAVFASSGNNGWTTGISFPACVPEAISVGAVYDADHGSLDWGVCTDPNADADTFACFTNSGDLLDLLAPSWKTTTVGRPEFGGTSAASPYAAAQGALLLQKNKNLSPSDLRTLMQQTGVSVVNPATSVAFPRADVAAALSLISVPALSAPGLAGLVTALLLTSRLARAHARRRRTRARPRS